MNENNIYKKQPHMLMLHMIYSRSFLSKNSELVYLQYIHMYIGKLYIHYTLSFLLSLDFQGFRCTMLYMF